jgi:cysteinylglycine-S-conjugate dipeptidase
MSDDVNALGARVAELVPRAHDDLARLVGFRSVADASLEPLSECIACANDVADLFRAVGLQDLELLPMPHGHPAVYGRRPAPPGKPTVLLYAHYDVQSPLDAATWQSPPFTLTERGGRWYGRGAADCKGNIVMHLTALRALGADLPVGIVLLAEGSEEQGLGELEGAVPGLADRLRPDAIVVGDAGNVALGEPTLETTLRGMALVDIGVETLASPVHSGSFGGPAPDALVALIHILGTLHDAAGNVTVEGIDARQEWRGSPYPSDRFRRDAQVLPGVDLLGSGTVADQVWARPSLTVLAVDCPRIVGSTGVVQAQARARVSLRVPPGMSAAVAQAALVAHLRRVAPWHVRVSLEEHVPGEPFEARTDGPAYAAMRAALADAYDRPVETIGQGGSIPLCNVFQETFPRAEIMLIGVEEPGCLIHAPNESVDPSEIEHMALAEALFLQRLGR